MTFFPLKGNTLWDNIGAKRERKQLGRGIGSGKGKTSGRGHKGFYARRGKRLNRAFQGGQSSLNRRLPKRGRSWNRFNTAEPLEVVSLFNLTYAAKKGRIDFTKPVTIKDMYKAGLMKKCEFGVRIISRGA